MAKSIILLAGLATLCAVPAGAQTVSIPVSFAGLDLNSAVGQDVLNRRLDQAVRSICGTADARDLAATMATHKCTIVTRASAQPHLAIAIAASRPSMQVASTR
ncbi:MAG: hypothetical protein JWL66_1018 [Sphingomonadales bacterium]|nr:hypothetical protein [Sphingomonadales bacterium]